MAEMEDRWLSVDEIGKYLGVSSDTVYRWIDKHAMPAHRMGRLWSSRRTNRRVGKGWRRQRTNETGSY